ncbi:integral membrane ATP-dependent zinc metallopeptidase [Campylobacter iguaniorum]|nr:integral membrane ATP-dependent zinc metallopeptidase [Campylobacter iguaniorum]
MITMPKFSLKFSPKNIIILVSVVLCLLLVFVALRNTPKHINLMQYDNLLQSNSIQSATLDNENIIIKAGNQNFIVLKDSINLNELGQKVAINSASGYGFLYFILLLILAIFGGFTVFKFIPKGKAIQRKKEEKELGSMVSNEVVPAISSVKFSDVAGIDEVKVELMEVVDFLKNPKAYKEFGIKMPKGVLMVGPPGVGKTLVAKAVAGEANVPFFYQSGASFVQIYAGMGAKRVRELFSMAKAYAPSIIFIDEIDAVGKARGGGRSDEREATLNQLLTEMDGFEDNSGVIVIAATNKIEMMDDALLRSGRFDRRIFLSLPDLKDRFAILSSYLKDKNHSVNIENLARNTTGFSSAGLATLVNEAAINALRCKRNEISEDDFKAVSDKVLFGKKKAHQLSKEEKEIQAIYQGSKALMAEFLGVEFDKISLLEDKFSKSGEFIESQSALLSKIKIHLVGYAALKIYKNELYTNSSKDLAKARELATRYVNEYAMNLNLIAGVNDIKAVLDRCMSETLEFVSKIGPQLEVTTKYLLENEIIDQETIKELIRKSHES